MTTKKQSNAPKLKNYLSSSPESAIFEAIRKTLAGAGAKRVVFDYDDDGRATAIEFIIEVGKERLAFRLPARIEQATPLVTAARKAARQGTTPDQVYRTVWATIRDWLDAQMALIQIGASRTEEVFLPYLLVEGNKTFFDEFAERRALPPPRYVIKEE